MMGTLILLLVFDFIFIFVEIRVWNTEDLNNTAWMSIKSMHGFGTFCFILINLLKILLTVFIWKAIGEKNRAVQTR